jgi:hypothetical protein
MISSSSPAMERGLGTMVLVYSLIQGHAAAAACEQALQGRLACSKPPQMQSIIFCRSSF